MIKEVDLKDLKEFSIDEINSPYRRYITYLENGNLFGYISFDIIDDRIEIINVFVKEDARGRKIATNMLKYLIDFARDKKIRNITLEVRCDNTFAIKLYDKCGFVSVATRKNYYNGCDGILMELIL